jgi:hypothetical protein
MMSNLFLLEKSSADCNLFIVYASSFEPNNISEEMKRKISFRTSMPLPAIQTA